jgi:TAG lipase/steryl ester hydrolase/phospholipase A2/LPA acyltransferase
MVAWMEIMGSSSRVLMSDAKTYEEWKAAAIAQDDQSGAADWRQIDRSRRYDYNVVRRRLEEVREVKASGDPHRILFYLNEGIHGNTGGMGSSSLYRRSEFGTKDLVSNYTRELAGALEILADVDDNEIPLAEKLVFFRRASHCFGRTAIMFSGGGSLGPFHVGVCTALLEQGLLPNVISGSSAGSIVAAILGTCTDDEVHATLEARAFTEGFEGISGGSSGLLKSPRQISAEDVVQFIERQIPDLTFREAFERTGRSINISISPRELHQQSRLMNAITSPNVYIRETVLASCAVPGIFPPVTLAAKNRDGERQPYIASRQWVDGSVTNDLPAKRLIRLYGVNHFITSQTNPVVLWSLRDTGAEDSLLSRLWEINQNASREWLRATFPLAMRLTNRFHSVNLFTRMAYGVAIQDYTADINIIPKRRFWNPAKFLSVLSEEETLSMITEGEASTWPKIEMIRNCTMISRTLDRILARLEEQSLNSLEPQSAGDPRRPAQSPSL